MSNQKNSKKGGCAVGIWGIILLVIGIALFKWIYSFSPFLAWPSLFMNPFAYGGLYFVYKFFTETDE